MNTPVRLGPKIDVIPQYPSTSSNPNYGVIWLFKDFREFNLTVYQPLSHRTFLFHCIVDEDKHSLLHHTSTCFNASLLIFKDCHGDLALRDYKFAGIALWVRVEDLPTSSNQKSLAINILERIGFCIFVDKNNAPKKFQRSTKD
ncbi:Early E3 18.5 kDa glycoprotein [Bienertia sinuspersici]